MDITANGANKLLHSFFLLLTLLFIRASARLLLVLDLCFSFTIFANSPADHVARMHLVTAQAGYLGKQSTRITRHIKDLSALIAGEVQVLIPRVFVVCALGIHAEFLDQPLLLERIEVSIYRGSADLRQLFLYILRRQMDPIRREHRKHPLPARSQSRRHPDRSLVLSCAFIVTRFFRHVNRFLKIFENHSRVFRFFAKAAVPSNNFVTL